MFLSFIDEYSEFFIILIGIIVGMILAYIIFFRPNNTHNNHEEPIDEKIEDNSENNLDLSFDSTDDELEDEYLTSADKEKFVLGANSNILESIKSNDEDSESVDDSDSNNEIDNTFSEEDNLENNKDDLVEPNDFSEIVSIEENHKDPEERLNKIVREVIPLNDYANQNIGKYHVLFRKDDKRWYVKREGKEEIEKFLLSQKEAIAYATIQALIYDTTIVVHDKDGKIGKYEF